MGLLDLFKATENKRLKEEIAQLRQLMSPEHIELEKILKKISELKKEEISLNKEIQQKNNQIDLLNEKYKTTYENLVILDEKVLMQDFGLYEPLYDFASSDDYKDTLKKNRDTQKEMIKNKTAVSYYDGWTVNGSKAEGKKMNNANIKQIIRTFNTECEVIIDKVKFNNIQSMEQRIKKSFDALNKMNETNRLSITTKFYDLKIEELHLAYEYQLKKQEEKEEQKRIREELREQAKLQKELQEAKKNITKDINHFCNALETVKQQLL
ncbi:DUF4041 domain-containing protein, partial [Turicibacter sanguinis]|nr:DUF4041 domain-containing protein [Turicibacter sanguinis]